VLSIRREAAARPAELYPEASRHGVSQAELKRLFVTATARRTGWRDCPPFLPCTDEPLSVFWKGI
jgi:hypothetical protein